MISYRAIGPVGRLVAYGSAIILALVVAVSSAWAQDDYYRSADGLAVYLGIMPAYVVRGHPPTHTERTMHGGAGTDRHEQHIVIAVFDSQTGARIENAEVTATISGLGHVGHQRVRLEAMEIADTITYGAFVDFAGSDRYDITVEIVVLGRSRPVSVNFPNEHR